MRLAPQRWRPSMKVMHQQQTEMSTDGASQLHRPSDLSDHLDPMTYPVLFPDGQPAWHPGLWYDANAASSKAEQRQKVRLAEF